MHRGVHTLSEEATASYEGARTRIARFINAPSDKQVVFTRGTTEGINLVAHTWGRANLKPGDEVLITAMEHHSNIVPWQILCEEKNAILKVIPMNDDGELLLDEFEKLLSPKTKFISLVHTSNSLGTINPVKEIIVKAHRKNIPVMIDGAQAIAHDKINVQDLDCDFYVFSGHKMCGPTGTGILYGKEKWLNKLHPYQGGGEMIETVTFEKTTYAGLPHKFEAGTPNIAGGIVLGTAVDYLNEIGFEAISHHEHELLVYATEKLLQIDGLKIYGTAKEKASVISFNIEGIHPYDIGTIIDNLGIAVRTGHHCAQPVMDFYKIPGTIRASLAFYNTKQEVDELVDSVKKAKLMLS